MRTFLGMIIGCLLTIAIVYVHDMSASSSESAANVENRPIVNWSVAAEKWERVTANARHAIERLKESVS